MSGRISIFLLKQTVTKYELEIFLEIILFNFRILHKGPEKFN